MAKGKIKRLYLNKGYGFIKPTTGGEDVFFHKTSVQQIQFEELQEGTIVEYREEDSPKGRRAIDVRVPNRATSKYHFINPYNFVSYLKKRPTDCVLGDCPPPPHDRYLGLTGKIICNVKAKTLLFVSDSHAVEIKNDHASYRFFQYDGQPALPASSLRGMIRSVFEAVTNSCYAAFQKDDYPLEYRSARAPDKLIPARVVELGDKEGEMLRPIAMPRVRYTYCRQDYLPDHLSYCEDYNKLCPACRVFGWVHKNGESDLQKPVAYAGRLRFSHGTIKESRGTENDLTLAILSTPKPTATEFYLLNSSGKPDPQIDYNNKDARLRGRKFYHHQEQAKEYTTSKKSDQNRTVRDALKPGATFTFEIDFENLSRLELGALIFALELEDEMFHRLGYAKPLGFGSVKISVEEIKTIDWEKRLKSIAPNAGWTINRKETASELKQEFLNKMRNLYGEVQFNKLLAELRILLGKQDLPIHYPRPTSQLDPDTHPSYEWFVGNKKRKFRYRLPNPVALQLPTEIGKGLPLIDKDGNEGT